MQLKGKGIFFSVWVLLIVLLAGCSTVPKKPGNPYLGYVYLRSLEGDTDYEQEGIESRLKGYTEQIASEEFNRRKNQFLGIQNEKSLDRMKKYVALLEQPIIIEESRWKGEADSLGKKEKKALEAYWESNKPFSLDGSKILTEWGSALSNAKVQILVDTRNVNGLESDIARLRKEKRFQEALTKVEGLRPYDSRHADELTRSLKEEAANYWAGRRMQEIVELREVEVYDGLHEQRILGLYSRICDDVSVFGHRESFNGVFAAWQELLGENWRKRIVKMGEDKAYWEAYGFARERYRDYVDAIRFDKAYREGLRLKIGKGYLEILDNAIRYYSDLASNAYKVKGLGGTAYVYCCMAKEMYDFITVANLGYHKGAETWFGRVSALEKGELLPVLESRVARRLVIQDFERDDLGLAKKFRQACKEKYAPGNNHAYGLEVITDKVALAQSASGTLPVAPSDYVVEWSRAEFEVKRRQGEGTPEVKFVKTDRIKVIDNPFRKDKSSPFYKMKQVKAQEVDQYTLINTDKRVDILCNMDVSCLHRGNKEMLKMQKTDRLVKETQARLGKVTSVTSTCSLPNVLSKMEYYPAEQNNDAIPLDVVPTNQIVSIPEEDWFEDYFSKTIVEDLDAELEGVIDMYPIELLTDASPDAQAEYLDALGAVLFYVVNLSSAEAAMQESAGRGYQWLHLRDKVAENTKEWSRVGGRWKAAKEEDKRLLRSLWEECINRSKEQDGR